METIDLNQIRKDFSLPKEEDFSGCLDGQHAYKYFGGLTLTEAYDIFLKNADFHYEDFQYLMPYAFFYYFPVIDKYWREVAPYSELDDLDFWHLESVISAQLSDKKIDRRLLPEIKKLCDFCEGLMRRVLTDPEELNPSLKRWYKMLTYYHKLSKQTHIIDS